MTRVPCPPTTSLKTLSLTTMKASGDIAQTKDLHAASARTLCPPYPPTTMMRVSNHCVRPPERARYRVEPSRQGWFRQTRTWLSVRPNPLALRPQGVLQGPAGVLSDWRPRVPNRRIRSKYHLFAQIHNI